MAPLYGTWVSVLRPSCPTVAVHAPSCSAFADRRRTGRQLACPNRHLDLPCRIFLTEYEVLWGRQTISGVSKDSDLDR